MDRVRLRGRLLQKSTETARITSGRFRTMSKVSRLASVPSLSEFMRAKRDPTALELYRQILRTARGLDQDIYQEIHLQVRTGQNAVMFILQTKGTREV